MENEKFFDLNNLFLDYEGFSKSINIPMEVLDLAKQKFDIDKAYKATKMISNFYTDSYKDRISNSYIILDDFSIYIKADEVESKYLRDREISNPIDDLYYSYERELKYTFPDSTYLEAALVSGDFLNMAKLDGVPSWVISQVLEIYGNTSNMDITLCIDFNVTIDYSVLEDSIKDVSVYNMIKSIKDINNYNELMEILKDKNVPLKMRTSAYGFYEDGDENDLIPIDNFDENNNIIKDCGTFNNFHFDYKKIIDDIYNELHK